MQLKFNDCVFKDELRTLGGGVAVKCHALRLNPSMKTCQTCEFFKDKKDYMIDDSGFAVRREAVANG